MIGLGLVDVKDISVRGLETVKFCDFVYLENYTSILQNSVADPEKLYGKKIILADRELVEKNADEILDKARDNEVAFLVVGDPMCATTHIDLWIRAKEKGIRVEVIHNSSIISAIGEIGLEVYKYGKVTSIPFHNKDVKTPVEVYNLNYKIGLHTLFLLDLEPKSSKFLSIREAAAYLINNGVDSKIVAIGAARIGAKDSVIHVGKLSEIGAFNYGNAPYALVIPGRMHFMEEEALELWKEK